MESEGERERERGTTFQSHDCPEVRRALGSWRPSQAPAGPCPCFPAREVPVTLPPPGRGTKKSGVDPERREGPPALCLASGRRPLAAPLGEGPPSTVMMALAPMAAPQSGPPGTTRTVRASALTFLDNDQGQTHPRVTACRGVSVELPGGPGVLSVASCVPRATLPSAGRVPGGGSLELPGARWALAVALAVATPVRWNH